jgi:hypothetical protein
MHVREKETVDTRTRRLVVTGVFLFLCCVNDVSVSTA